MGRQGHRLLINNRGFTSVSVIIEELNANGVTALYNCRQEAA